MRATAVAEVVKTFGFPATNETLDEFRYPEIEWEQTTMHGIHRIRGSFLKPHVRPPSQQVSQMV
jgi:hypothetical protein